jgi:hypothetical protein
MVRLNTLYIIAVCALLPLFVGGWVPISHASNVSVLECTQADSGPPVYYAIDLISTKKIRGARRASGIGNVMYAPSPFGVSVSSTGHYVYDLDIQLEKIDAGLDGQLVAWVTTTDLKEIRLLGPLNETFQTQGRVDFNKFLVVITLEPSGESIGEMWTGPVVLRGMSRSGLMHTKAGHGPFQVENCASYGYS